MQRPRVLLCAYQCAPGLGSVSQIGWEWYARLSRRAQVTLVTHSRNRKPLEQAGAAFPGSDIVFVDTEWFAGPLHRLAKRLFPRSEHAVFALSSVDFYLYDFWALHLLRKRPKRHWDVVHAVTPVSPLAATRLFKLGPPLIIGPWNGGMTSSPNFMELLQGDSRWVYRIREFGRIVDRFIGCAKHASLILSATKTTDASIPEQSRGRVRRMVENGVELSAFRPGSWDIPSPQKPLRVLFVGRLVPVKGILMLLEAVARVRDELNLELTIVGDGPMRGEIEQDIARRDLQSIVHLTGNLPLRDVALLMGNCHLFCLPSVRESGGAVLLEAMACAVPVVAVDYGGPAEIVDGEVGKLLSADGSDALISDLVSVFRDVLRNPAAWRKRGLAGRARAENRYGWEAKIDEAMALYEQVIAKGKANV